MGAGLNCFLLIIDVLEYLYFLLVNEYSFLNLPTKSKFSTSKAATINTGVNILTFNINPFF